MEKAQEIFNRLTEVDKINLRAAKDARLEFLSNSSHLVDLPLHSFDERVNVVREVQALCFLEFSSKSSNVGFEGVTWKF